LKAQAACRGGQFEFDHVVDACLDELFSGVAAVVMPSLVGEVFGLVAAENMLRGKLLIVSDTGAPAEVVGDTGLVFTAGGASALALCRHALDDPSLGSVVRLRTIQMFNRNSMIQGHVSLYRKVLARGDAVEISKTSNKGLNSIFEPENRSFQQMVREHCEPEWD
jgi:hypothetical protein